MMRFPPWGVVLMLLACLLALPALAQEPSDEAATPPENVTIGDGGDVDDGAPEEALGDDGDDGLAGARFGTTTLVILLVLSVVVVGLIVALGARRP